MRNYPSLGLHLAVFFQEGRVPLTSIITVSGWDSGGSWSSHVTPNHYVDLTLVNMIKDSGAAAGTGNLNTVIQQIGLASLCMCVCACVSVSVCE